MIVSRWVRVVSSYMFGEVGEGVETGVDVLAAAFDEAVGAPQEQRAGWHVEGGLCAGRAGAFPCSHGDAQRHGSAVGEVAGVAVGDQQGWEVSGAGVAEQAGGGVVVAVADGGEGEAGGGEVEAVQGVRGPGGGGGGGGGDGGGGDGAEHGVDTAHGGGGVQVVAHDVADDQADAVPGEREHVVPVAADVVVGVGGPVGGGCLDAG